LYRRRIKTKQKHNTIFVGHHYTQTNTNNVNKTCTLLQATGGKDEPNIVIMGTPQQGTQRHKKKLNIWATRTPTKNRRWTQGLANG